MYKKLYFSVVLVCTPFVANYAIGYKSFCLRSVQLKSIILANTSHGTTTTRIICWQKVHIYVAADDDVMLSTINDSNDNNKGQTTSNNYPVASNHNSTAKVAKAMAIASWQHHTQWIGQIDVVGQWSLQYLSRVVTAWSWWWQCCCGECWRKQQKATISQWPPQQHSMHHGRAQVSLQNRVVVKWQWQQLSGAIATQQDSWEEGEDSGHGCGNIDTNQWPWQWPVQEVKLGIGNRVMAVHSEWWWWDSGAATWARTFAAQQGWSSIVEQWWWQQLSWQSKWWQPPQQQTSSRDKGKRLQFSSSNRKQQQWRALSLATVSE